MSAPVLQAQGATATGVTTGVPSITIPTHQAGDIIVVHLMAWVPNTTTPDAAQIPTPSGWTPLGSQVGQPASGDHDGWSALFWLRATGAGTTVTPTRGAGWDTGTDTCYNGRAYVIRGCAPTGDPFDPSPPVAGPYQSANQNFPAVTVENRERMVMIFGAAADNLSFSMASSGWTTGTEDADNGGTDSNFQTARQDNVDASTSADASTVTAVATFYAFHGVAFKPLQTALPAAPVRMLTVLVGALTASLTANLNAAPCRIHTRLTTSGITLAYKAGPARANVRLTGNLATVLALNPAPVRMLTRLTGGLTTTVSLPAGPVRALTRLTGAASAGLALNPAPVRIITRLVGGLGTAVPLPAAPVRVQTRLTGQLQMAGIDLPLDAGPIRIHTRVITSGIVLSYKAGPVRMLTRLTGQLTAPATTPLPTTPVRIITRLTGDLDLLYPLGPVRINTRLIGQLTTQATVALTPSPVRMVTCLLGQATTILALPTGPVRALTRLTGAASTMVALPAGPIRSLTRLTGNAQAVVAVAGVLRMQTRLTGALTTAVALPAGPVRVLTRLLGPGSLGVAGLPTAPIRIVTRLTGELVAIQFHAEGKYRPEHDQALVDLGEAHGFAADHAAARQAIEDAGV